MPDEILHFSIHFISKIAFKSYRYKLDLLYFLRTAQKLMVQDTF